MKSPAFSFYVRDWLCSKTVSKLHSKGVSKGVSAYMYLLCKAWLEEPRGTVPDDPIEMAGMAQVSAEEWAVIWPHIESQFPVGEGGRRYNERLVAESNKQNKRSISGSKGGSKTQANRQAASEDAIEDEDVLTNTNRSYSPSSRVALHYLNESSGKHFRECESSLAPINARLKEADVTIEGVKLMIARQCKQWRGTKMEEYLRPQTLFGKEKFDGYYAAREMPINTNDAVPAKKPQPQVGWQA